LIEFDFLNEFFSDSNIDLPYDGVNTSLGCPYTLEYDVMMPIRLADVLSAITENAG
jgi:hypothetical protein